MIDMADDTEMTVEQRLSALEAAKKALETKNRALETKSQALETETEIKALRPPPPKPAAPAQLVGQGPRVHNDMTGQHYCGEPSAPPGSGGGSGSTSWNLNPWGKSADGEKVWRPDGIRRNPQTGEIWQPAPAQAPPLVPLDAFHDRQVVLLDQMFEHDAQRQAAEKAASDYNR